MSLAALHRVGWRGLPFLCPGIAVHPGLLVHGPPDTGPQALHPSQSCPPFGKRWENWSYRPPLGLGVSGARPPLPLPQVFTISVHFNGPKSPGRSPRETQTQMEKPPA